MADYGDVMMSDDVTSAMTSEPGDVTGEAVTSACQLYKFVVNSVNGLVCVLGFIGNIVAFVVFNKDTMKTSTSFLFQALSVIDNVLIVTAFPLYFLPTFVTYTELYPGYNHLSAFHQFVLVYDLPVAFVAQTATIWVTVLVAVNRYIAVCRPYQAARLCTVRQAKLQLGIVLTCVLLYNLPRFCEAKLVNTAYNTTDGRLAYRLEPSYTSLGSNELYLIVYHNILYAVLMLSVPLVALTGLNVRLIRALTALRRKRAEMQGGRTSTSSQDSNVTLVLVIVVLVFTVCQTPALATQLMWSLLGDDARLCGGLQFYFSTVSNLLVIVNSAANFPVYLFFNTRFRLVLRQLVGCPASHGDASGAGVTRSTAMTTAAGKSPRAGTTSRADHVKEGENAEPSQLLQPLLAAADDVCDKPVPAVNNDRDATSRRTGDTTVL